MGKAGNVQPKAEAKAKVEPKAKVPASKAAAPSGKDAPTAAAAVAAAQAAAAEDAAAKLLEEAQQKWGEEEKEERVRVEMREHNRKARTSRTPLGGNRDKSIARVTKFQNRLKLFKGESELDSLLKDIDGVDGSKYVSELAENLLEAAGTSLKLKELAAVTKVCSRLHVTYDEFSALLAKAIDKAYTSTPPTELNRRRFLLRMCAELCLTECFIGPKLPLLDMVKDLCDISVSEEQLVTNFTIIGSLVQKHAVSCFSVAPSKLKNYEEALGKAWVTRQCVLEDSLRTQLQQLLVNAYQSSGSGLLTSAHSRIVEQEKLHTKLKVDKGAVDPENEQKMVQLKEAFTKLQANFSTLAENLNQPMVTLQQPEEETGASRIVGRQDKAEEGQGPEDNAVPLWEDNEQQKFYEEILDPKDVIPAVLLGKPAAGTEAAADGEKGEKEEKKEGEKEEKEKPEKEKPEKEVKDLKGAASGTEFELYLLRIGKAETPKQVDEIVIEFFHEFNTKANRRMLAATLLGVQRNKLHLLAPHARLLATIAPYMKEVPQYVLTGLQQELETLLAEKDPVAIESKVRTVRFLCELCKFKICPPGIILDAIKVFCDDFSQHHAELCANIFLCCGRYLMYTPETSMRTENLLERMNRLKNAKSLPLRLEIMLEDAYFHVKPPEGKRKQVKDKEPLEQFTEYLVFDLLHKEEDEDKLVKLVRKLPWDGPAPGWLKRCLLDLNMHANYESLYQVASLLSMMAKYRDFFVIDVIDALFENIQMGIERNDFREMPLRVRQMKLLGELYNYRLVDSTLIFDTMYQLIGHCGASAFRASQTSTVHKIIERLMAARRTGLGSISEEDLGEESGNLPLPAILADPQHPLEATWDYFRIKLVCVLLDTCGHYFDRGTGKQKLDRFLTFFIRYVHSKGELPLRFMHMVLDTLEKLRPKLVFPEQKPEADEAVTKLLATERAQHADLGWEEKEEREDEEEEDSTEGEEEDEESGQDEESSEEESEEEDESDSDGDDNQDYDRGDRRHFEELEEFDKEVQQMMADSLAKEKTAPRALAELPEPPPSKKTDAQQPPGVFTLMQKKVGGKMLLKQIEIPDDSKLMRAIKVTEEETSKEKEDLKRYIMQYEESSSAPVVPMRAGKGGKKGRYDPRPRQDDYVADGLLPSEKIEPHGVEHRPPAHRGGGKGGGKFSSGGKSSGSSGAVGGIIRRRPPPEGKGTPSTPVQGVL